MKNSSLFKAVLTSAKVVALSTSLAHAGYLDVSGNWKAPQTREMSKKAAISEVGKCHKVQSYLRLGHTSGAMIVAGPHTTPADSKTHLTVRLYRDNIHNKSCHVYINESNRFSSCSCNTVH